MAAEVFANSPATSVTAGGTTAPVAGTTETWTVLSSASFPAASTGVTQFHVVDVVQPSEVILVTNVSGTTWTVTRGAESSTPIAHAAGFTVYQVVTAGFLTNPSFQGQVTAGNGITPLNANPTFESGISPWTGGNGATVAQSSVWAWKGTFSLKITPNGITANPKAVSELTIPVSGGTAYSAVAMFYCPSGYSGVAGLQIDWYTSGGSYISTTGSPSFAVPAGTPVQLSNVNAASPSNAAKADIYVYLSGTPSSSVVAYIDEAALFASSAANAGQVLRSDGINTFLSPLAANDLPPLDSMQVAAFSVLPVNSMGLDAPFGVTPLRVVNNNTNGGIQLVVGAVSSGSGDIEFWVNGAEILGAGNNISFAPPGQVNINPTGDVVLNGFGVFRCHNFANFFASMQFQRVVVTHSSSPYGINVNTDYILGCDSSAGAITLLLPNITYTGQVYIIKDETGYAAKNNITVNPQGGQTIGGLPSYVISSSFGEVTLYSTGTGWAIASEVPVETPVTGPAVVQTAVQDCLSQNHVGITLGSSPVAGNVLIAFCSYSQFSVTRTITTPAGWTKIDDITDSSTSGLDSLATFYHVVQPGDGTSYTFSIVGASNDLCSGIMYELSGVNTANPVNQHAATVNPGSGNSATTGSVTPSAPGCLALACWGTEANVLSETALSAGWTLDASVNANFHGTWVARLIPFTRDKATAISATITYGSNPGGNAEILLLNPAPAIITPGGLPGATAATRYVGGITGGAPPSSGTFAAGDFVIDQNGFIWICTVGGSPGTWKGTLTVAANAATTLQVFGSSAFLSGFFDISTIGAGLQVAEGSNAKQGTVALVAGSKVVSNTSVTANSRIFLTSNADGGTPGWLRVSARTAGTSFTITSSSNTDTSTVAYEIFEPG